MAHTGVPFLIPITLNAPGDAAVADDIDHLTMEFDAVIWAVQMQVGTTGDTSGETDVVVERTRDGSSADLWTVAADCGRIAYDASANYLEWDWENDAWAGYASGQLVPPSGCVVKTGDEIQLNIDAIPGGTTSTDVKVVLWVKPVVD